MANLGDMIVRIVGDNAEFDSSIDKSESKLTKFEKTTIKIGQSLSLFVTTPLLALGVAAVKSSAEMEMLEASFTTMLGSAAKASSLMASLKDMAARTPFETTGLANATKTLLQFGVELQDILPTLQKLGDVSGGNQARFNSLALVFGQVKSAGRLMGQDLLQLINAGFNPLQEISRKTGESMALLKDKMTKGAITFEMVAGAFKSATSEGGKFYNGMATASKTLDGLISTMKDDVATLGRSFIEDLLPTIKDTVKGISSLAQIITGLDSGTKKTILSIAGFAIALGPGLVIVGTAVKLIGALSLGMSGVAAATSASSGALALNKIGLIGHTVATGLMTAANGLLSKSMVGAALATKGLTMAIAATGIGALVIGLGLAIAAIVKFVQKNKEAKKAQEELNKEMMNKQVDQLIEKYGKVKDSRQRILEIDKQLRESGDQQVLSILEIVKLEKIRADILYAIEGRARAVSEAERKAAQAKLDALDKQIQNLRNVAKPLSDDQKLIADTNKLILDEFKIIDQKAKLALKQNEEYDASQEKKKFVIEKINELITKGFTVEGSGIQSILLANKNLMAYKKESIAEIKAEQKEEQKEEAEAIKEEIKNFEEKFKLQDEFATLQQTNYEKAFSQIVREREAFIAAGVDRVTVNKWAHEEIMKLKNSLNNLDQTSYEEEMKRIDNQAEEYKKLGYTKVEIDAWAANEREKINSKLGRLNNTELQNELQAIEERKEAYRDAGESEVDIEKWALNEKLKLLVKYSNEVLSSTKDLASEVFDIINDSYQNQIDAVNEKKDADLQANDEALQAALVAAGVADKTAVESAQLKVDTLRAQLLEESDAEKKAQLEKDILEAQAALTKAKIQEEYEAKAKIIKEKAARDAWALEVKQFNAKKAINIAQTAIDAAAAALSAAKDTPGGPILKGLAAAAMIALGAAKIAVISQQEPPSLQLAEGGIVVPRVGGVNATLAEAGKPEVVFPLDKLNKFISTGNVNGSSSNSDIPIRLTVQLDSKPFLDTIFNATKNKTVLISARAIV